MRTGYSRIRMIEQVFSNEIFIVFSRRAWPIKRFPVHGAIREMRGEERSCIARAEITARH
jgi:hypothetical protein